MKFTDLSRPPRTIAVADIDHLLLPPTGWWPFRRRRPDPLAEALATAREVIVPHHRLRALLLERYEFPSERVRVVGHGLPDNHFGQATDTVTRRITKEVYGREHSYFLAAAPGHPLANTDRVIAAYDRFRNQCAEPVRLLLAGTERAQPRAVRRALRKARHRAGIEFVSLSAGPERGKVLAAARAVLCLSLSSAFPVAILEAWHAEVPVIAGDNDILEGAGALVRATDAESIAGGMLAVVTTPFLASGLVENGRRRRGEFTWDKVRERVAELPA